MNLQGIKKLLIAFIGTIFLSVNLYSQDLNFYIFICFGQSNMEGQGTIETQDKTVDSRFKVMEATDCTNLGRKKGLWYTATPPLSRCYTGLSPSDYFGRTMVATLPDSIKVGVINVSVAGCKIELFDKDTYKTYVSSITEDWLKNIIGAYNGNPYGYLIELAKLAQKDGVIKGILLHQGESNTGDSQWPTKVKNIYNNFIKDLELNAESTPFLAGEVVHADQGGICASMNAIIAKLPQTLPNSYVISSSGCTDATDNLHFNSAGYRELGRRYAVKMLTLMGYEPKAPEPDSIYFEAECASVGKDWYILPDSTASNNTYITVKPGTQSLSAAPTNVSGLVRIPFTAKSSANYSVYGRVNCPSADDDSYWIRMDEGAYINMNGLFGKGWEWKKLGSYELVQGNHTLSIGYREDGAKLDKIYITNTVNSPTGNGLAAVIQCTPETTKVGIASHKITGGYALESIYPNPLSGKTNISFVVPFKTFVSIKIFNSQGKEVAELAGREFTEGKHMVEFEPVNLRNGIYFCKLKAEAFSASQKIIINR
jgi:hypothetical protein